MSKKTLFLAAVAPALLGSCALLDGPRQNKPQEKCSANHPVCHIDVHVAKCEVTVDPEWKRVASRPGGVTMIWTLRTPGAGFAANGIQFKKETPVFTPKGNGEGRPTFVMHNRGDPGNYLYTVNVIDNGKKCDPHDPGVVNEM